MEGVLTFSNAYISLVLVLRGGSDRGVGKPSHQSGLMRIFGVRKQATALFVVVDVTVVRTGLI